MERERVSNITAREFIAFRCKRNELISVRKRNSNSELFTFVYYDKSSLDGINLDALDLPFKFDEWDEKKISSNGKFVNVELHIIYVDAN